MLKKTVRSFLSAMYVLACANGRFFYHSYFLSCKFDLSTTDFNSNPIIYLTYLFMAYLLCKNVYKRV